MRVGDERSDFSWVPSCWASVNEGQDGFILAVMGIFPAILPWQGRWQHEVLTEGCHPSVSGTPLRHALRARHLPCKGEDDA